MITIILIGIYIITIFLGRYFDIKTCIHIYQIHYKQHLIYWMWFIPVINIWWPFLNYVDHEISTRKKDIKHNKFINWFFVGINYQTKESKKCEKEFDEFFNKTRSVDSNTIKKVKEQLKYTNQ